MSTVDDDIRRVCARHKLHLVPRDKDVHTGEFAEANKHANVRQLMKSFLLFSALDSEYSGCYLQALYTGDGRDAPPDESDGVEDA